MTTATIFAGTSSTDFGAPAIATTTGTPSITSAGGTRSEVAPIGLAPIPDPENIIDWLRSSAARAYEGKWVMLDENMAVLDSDSSPSALISRHTELVAPKVVFVQPSSPQIAV